MKHTKFLLTLSLMLVSALFSVTVLADASSEAWKAAVAIDAPAVPNSKSVDDYKSYLAKCDVQLNEAVTNLVKVAQENKIDSNSDEYNTALTGIVSRFTVKTIEALDKALAIENLSDEDLEKLVAQRLGATPSYCQVTGTKEEVELANFAANLRKWGKDVAAKALDDKLFNDKIKTAIQQNDAKTFGRIFDTLKEEVEKAGKDVSTEQAFKMAKLVMNSSHLRAYTLEKGVAEKLIDQFAHANNPKVVDLATQFELSLIYESGNERQLNLPGKEFKFEGKFIDGTKYDPKDYAGKVLLVEVWATWCGPCCEEQTTVRNAYAKYHDKGFEVIGISCDDPNDVTGFQDFLKTYRLDWKQMFDNDVVVPGLKTVTGKPVPITAYYAIHGIPRPILIGKDGKVVTINARGPELERLLAELLGEAKK